MCYLTWKPFFRVYWHTSLCFCLSDLALYRYLPQRFTFSVMAPAYYGWGLRKYLTHVTSTVNIMAPRHIQRCESEQFLLTLSALPCVSNSRKLGLKRPTKYVKWNILVLFTPVVSRMLMESATLKFRILVRAYLTWHAISRYKWRWRLVTCKVRNRRATN